MAVDLSPGNVVDVGILLNANFSTTALLVSKVLDNSKRLRDNTTSYCLCSQAGTWIIYDVDEKGNVAQIVSNPVTANTLTVYTYPHAIYRNYHTFTPSATTGSGTDFVIIRSYPVGYGNGSG